MPFHAARFVLRVIAHPDATYFAMIALTFAAFIVCAAIEFTPDAGPARQTPQADRSRETVAAGVHTPTATIESE